MGLKQTFQKSKVGNFPNSWSKTWPVLVFSGSHPIYSSIDWTENMNLEEVKKKFSTVSNNENGCFFVPKRCFFLLILYVD